MFKHELEMIQTDFIREQTQIAIDNLPEYFMRVTSSSTGKYHREGETLYQHSRAGAIVGADLSNLEMFELSEIERDLVIAALILHDGRKRGKNYSDHTKHEHPMLSAELVREHCDKDFADAICPLIESHSGQWSTSKWSKIVLPKPETKLQKIVHLCDYIASRRYMHIEISDDGVEKK